MRAAARVLLFFLFFFLRFRSLQGDCDGSSKQAFGGPQPARLVKRFLTVPVGLPVVSYI